MLQPGCQLDLEVIPITGRLPWWNTWACLWLRPRWRSLSRPRPSSSCAGPGLPPWLTLWWRYLRGGNPYGCSTAFTIENTDGCGFFKEATCRTQLFRLKPVKDASFLFLHRTSNELVLWKFVFQPYNNNHACSGRNLSSWWQWFLHIYTTVAADNKQASV